ncbi:MAG: L,D-transpeptidase [Acidimicrobiales bacterium]|nr:L,D-transpeptidase [Acidimicrobiales bacterium]
MVDNRFRRAPQVRPVGPARRAALVATTIVSLLAFLAGCSGDRPTLEAAPSTLPGSTTRPAPTTTTTPLTALPTSPVNVLGFIATPKGSPNAQPQVYAEPSRTATKIDVPARTMIGAPTTFAVIGDPERQPSSWYKVMLPIRPNTAVGWVEASTVDLTKTDVRIFVDLEGRTIRAERAGREVFRAPIAIGTETNPTPTGPAYMTELIKNTNPAGAYGPYAFGLSVHSDTLTEFEGGDGQVGIHGTNKPQLIGERVSHGCVRLSNSDIQKLVDLQLPLGAPVFIS